MTETQPTETQPTETQPTETQPTETQLTEAQELFAYEHLGCENDDDVLRVDWNNIDWDDVAKIMITELELEEYNDDEIADIIQRTATEIDAEHAFSDTIRQLRRQHETFPRLDKEIIIGNLIEQITVAQPAHREIHFSDTGVSLSQYLEITDPKLDSTVEVRVSDHRGKGSKHGHEQVHVRIDRYIPDVTEVCEEIDRTLQDCADTTADTTPEVTLPQHIGRKLAFTPRQRKSAPVVKQPAQLLACGRMMPIAKRRCVLPKGHQGSCRSKR